MAYLGEYIATTDTSTVTTHTARAMPAHASGDVLMWFVNKDEDAGGDLTTPSGWTNLLHQTTTANRIAIFYKVASGSSESAPSTTTTATDTFTSHMVTIKDADTADLINISTSTNHGGGPVSSDTISSVTTDETDCLVIHFMGSDRNNGFTTDPGPYFYACDGDGNQTSTITWDFQKTAAASRTFDFYGMTAFRLCSAVVAINNATSGAIPVYNGSFSDAGTVFHPMMNTSTQHGGTPSITASPTTIGSKTLADAGVVATVTNGGIHPGLSSTNFRQYSATTTPSTAASTGQLALSPVKDVSGGFLLFSILSPDIVATKADLATLGNDAVMMSVVDSTNNYRAWTFAGINSDPEISNRTSVIIDCSKTDTQYAASGTAPDLTDIDTIQWMISVGSVLDDCYINDMLLVGTLVLVGGDSSRPLNSNRLREMGKSYRHAVVQNLSLGAYLSIVPLQIGNGTAPVYMDLSNVTLQFPEQPSATNSSGQNNVHINSADIGISYYGVSGDTIKHTNSTVTALSEYYWEIHASATSSATWDFSGLTIIKASVTLRDVTTFDQMNFFDCIDITASSCDLTNCTISGLTDNNALVTNSTTTLDTCTFNTTDLAAGEYMCSVADPSIFTDCNFTGSSSTGHAIRITTAGTYTFTGNIFTGYGADTTTSAAIYNDSGGAVTINIAGGGGTPTYRNGTSATTTINNATTVSVTVKDASTLAAIQSARVLVKADTGGDLPAADSVSITRSGTTASVSHTAHGLVSGDEVVILGATQDEYNGIFTISNVTTNAYDYTVSGTPASPATGTITSTAVIVNGTTNASGVISNAGFSYTSDQPITGTVRKSSASTYYKPGIVSGTVLSTGFTTNVLLVGDE